MNATYKITDTVSVELVPVPKQPTWFYVMREDEGLGILSYIGTNRSQVEFEAGPRTYYGEFASDAIRKMLVEEGLTA
jgi:hypothetical protein